MEKVKEILKNIDQNWAKDKNLDNYSFLNEVVGFIYAYQKVIVQQNRILEEKGKSNVSIYALNLTVFHLLQEIVLGVISGQRVATQVLLRSIIENYAVMKFLSKYGNEAFQVYYADSQVKKIKHLIKGKLTSAQVHDLKKREKVLRSKFNKFELGRGFNWTKAFIRKNVNKKETITLKKLTDHLELKNDYIMYKSLSDATHSSDLFTHDLNNFRINNFVLYTMPVYFGTGFALDIARLSYNPLSISKLEELGKLIDQKYAKVNGVELSGENLHSV